jgi:hypothetical protein
MKRRFGDFQLFSAVLLTAVIRHRRPVQAAIDRGSNCCGQQEIKRIDLINIFE